METSAFGGQAKPVAVNATGFNRWKFTNYLLLGIKTPEILAL
jgi:hypothetical protein